MLNQSPNDFLRDIPNNLPVPADDGACNHLEGLTLPSVDLPSTAGGTINPSQIPGWLVIYCYPMTGWAGAGHTRRLGSDPGSRGLHAAAHHLLD